MPEKNDPTTTPGEEIREKACSRCGETKPLEEYGKERRAKDGHTAECKVCARARNAKFYRDNRESRKAYVERHREVEWLCPSCHPFPVMLPFALRKEHLALGWGHLMCRHTLPDGRKLKPDEYITWLESEAESAERRLEAAEAATMRLSEALGVIREAPYDAAGLREIARLMLINEKYRAEALTNHSEPVEAPKDVVVSFDPSQITPVLEALNAAAKPPYCEDVCHQAALRVTAALGVELWRSEPVEAGVEEEASGGDGS